MSTRTNWLVRLRMDVCVAPGCAPASRPLRRPLEPPPTLAAWSATSWSAVPLAHVRHPSVRHVLAGQSQHLLLVRQALTLGQGLQLALH